MCGDMRGFGTYAVLARLWPCFSFDALYYSASRAKAAEDILAYHHSGLYLATPRHLRRPP